MVQTGSLVFKFGSQNLCVFHAKTRLRFANSWIKVLDVEIYCFVITEVNVLRHHRVA